MEFSFDSTSKTAKFKFSISIGTLVFLVLLALKLLNIIEIEWLWVVLIPLIVSAVITIIMFVILGVIMAKAFKSLAIDDVCIDKQLTDNEKSAIGDIMTYLTQNANNPQNINKVAIQKIIKKSNCAKYEKELLYAVEEKYISNLYDMQSIPPHILGETLVLMIDRSNKDKDLAAMRVINCLTREGEWYSEPIYKLSIGEKLVFPDKKVNEVNSEMPHIYDRFVKDENIKEQMAIYTKHYLVKAHPEDMRIQYMNNNFWRI